MPGPSVSPADAASLGKRVGLLLVSMLAIVALHFSIPTETHWQHQLHIAARKLYFLPPVVAAAWFAMRGAWRATAAMSLMFALHAVLKWPSDVMERANQLSEFISLWIVGLVAGALFDRERALLEELAAAHQETVTGLVSALDLREHDTGLHSQRVRAYALLLAERIGLDVRRRNAVGLGALLHDVGKIAVPDRILLKEGPLSSEERAVMCEHPAAGHRIVEGVHVPSEAAEIVLSHHERFDGLGYPRGLAGAAIPLGARLFAVADAYDALTSRRPYRRPVSHAEAVATIRANAGTQFDPTVVATLVDVPESALQQARHAAESAGRP